MRRWLVRGGWIALAVLVLLSGLRSLDPGELGAHLKDVAIPILACALVVRSLNFCFFALRSALLLAPLHRYSFWVLLKSALLVHAVNNLIPFRAGEAARVGYLSGRGQVPASSCLAVIAVERLFDLMGLFVIVLCTVPAVGIGIPLGAPACLAFSALAVTLGAVWVSKRPERFIGFVRRVSGLLGSRFARFASAHVDRFAEGLVALKSLRTLAAVAGLSLLYWLTAAFIMQLWIWALGFEVPWYAPVIVLAFVNFGLAIPATPGHIGTYHVFAASAMMTVGLAQSQAIAFAVIAHAMAVIPFTLLSGPILLRDFLGYRGRGVSWLRAPWSAATWPTPATASTTTSIASSKHR